MGKCQSLACVRIDETDPRYDAASYLEYTPFSLLLDRRDLELFSGYFIFLEFAAGDEIVERGSHYNDHYVVAEGEVNVWIREDEERDDVLLCRKHSGDFFGTDPFDMISDADPKLSDVKVTSVDRCIIMKLTHYRLQSFLSKKAKAGRDDLKDGLKRIRDEIISVFDKVNWLRGVPHEFRSWLTQMFHYKPLEKDQTLFKEGSMGRDVYIVAHGKLHADSTDYDGRTKVMNTFNHGDYFGEIGLACSMPRTADVIASDSSLLLQLTKEDCDKFFNLNPEYKDPFQLMLKKRTAESFRKYNIPFLEMIPEDKYQRLAELCVIQQVAPKSVVFHEGADGRAFYLIVHGQLIVTHKTDDETIVLAEMGPGEYFGEIALVKETKRSATVSTLTRSVLLSITKKNFDVFFEEVPESLVDFQVKLARYNVTLKQLIHHPKGQDKFAKHLKMEYAMENIEFWKVVQTYKRMQNPTAEERLASAEKIAVDFIEEKSQNMVNLASHVRDRILAKVYARDVSKTTFLEAEKEIFGLMQADSFARFKQSKLFQEFLNETKTYKTVKELKGSNEYTTYVLDRGDLLNTQRRERLSTIGQDLNEVDLERPGLEDD